ncbi:MAG TPA: SpoIID/LytB domain-containing protein [Anaeromyxobacter sp.]|nr:SpoIID/LytB domain-containing protein [Anaeromyxobacter sp.]
MAAPAARRLRRRLAPGALGLALLAAAWPASRARAEERLRVRAGGEVKDLRLEDYVAGVVSGEMPASFPPEALKAQAVAARSSALTRKIEAQAAGRAFDIGTGVLHQVWAERPSAAARAAAEATAGEVLVSGREPVEAYFHAACGGRTEGGLAALGRDLPYLAPVECGKCGGAPGVAWKVRVGAADLARAAGLAAGAGAARVATRTATGRAERVEVAAGGRTAAVAAVDLRQRLGFDRLPSLAFDVRGEGGGFVLEGRGRGHGAGLCQWGAAALAREGLGYREILARYYPGTDVVRMY